MFPDYVQNWTRHESDLRRNKHDYFEDNDLAELLFDAVEANAGCPGGRAVPGWARGREILKLKQARQANVCTLNEFRQHLGLKRALIHALLFPHLNVPFIALQSFEEWNPKLANIARDLFNDINMLELYVKPNHFRIILIN